MRKRTKPTRKVESYKVTFYDDVRHKRRSNGPTFATKDEAKANIVLRKARQKKFKLRMKSLKTHFKFKIEPVFEKLEL